MSPTLQPHWLYSPWNSPGRNTGVGSCFLLQGIFPTQGSNPHLPHCRWNLHRMSHQGSAIKKEACLFTGCFCFLSHPLPLSFCDSLWLSLRVMRVELVGCLFGGEEHCRVPLLWFPNVTIGYLLCVTCCAGTWRRLSILAFADCSWDSHGTNTGVVCHSLLQETFPFGTGGGNIGRRGWVGLYCRRPWGLQKMFE